MNPANEFSIIVKLDDIGTGTSQHNIAASASERAGLAIRFDLISLDELSAKLGTSKTAKGVLVKGILRAKVRQACVATGEPITAEFNEPIEIIFISEPEQEGEFELAEKDCDSMFHDGKGIDIGEAAAQTLGLLLDPYPRSLDAEAKLRSLGVKTEDEVAAQTGPFAALAGFKDTLAQ
jgi:uncharacterized metal-binding protein YceD (DUF177 family)